MILSLCSWDQGLKANGLGDLEILEPVPALFKFGVLGILEPVPGS